MHAGMKNNNTHTMKRTFSILIPVLLPVLLQAQFAYDYLKAADAYYRKQDYASAAGYYEKHLASVKSKAGASYNPYTLQTRGTKGGKTPVSSESQARLNLAESYRLLKQAQKAADAYEKVDAADFPLTRYHLAAQYRALGKYAEAEAALQQFVAAYTAKDAYAERAAREIENLRFIQRELKKPDLALYKVDRMPEDVNAGGANYAASFGPGNEVWFTSTRIDSNWKGAKYANRLYRGSYDNGKLSGIADVGLPQDPAAQQGTATVSPDGKRVWITRWGMRNGRKLSGIWLSVKGAEGWSVPVPAGPDVNDTLHSAQQPFLMSGGRQMLLSSDRPGGSGGFDLWVADIDRDGMLFNLRNLGASVNTVGDEHAPYFHAPSGSLVFSSDGRVGMGGFDLYLSRQQGTGWEAPSNLGYPVNSPRDDIYFVSRSINRYLLSEALVSSDRSAECCLEMFTLRKARVPSRLVGTVVSCENNAPVGGATVSIAGRTVTTGLDGAYAFQFDEFVPVSISAKAEGYEDKTIQVAAPGEDVVKLDAPTICLKLVPVFPPPVGTIEALENINFNFNRSVILDASKPYLDKLAEKLLANPTTVLEISGHTDSKGADDFNMKLSEARASEVVKYLVGKGVKPEQLVARGYGETIPLAPNENADGTDSAEGRRLNRRTEFKVLKQ